MLCGCLRRVAGALTPLCIPRWRAFTAAPASGCTGLVACAVELTSDPLGATNKTFGKEGVHLNGLSVSNVLGLLKPGGACAQAVAGPVASNAIGGMKASPTPSITRRIKLL